MTSSKTEIQGDFFPDRQATVLISRKDLTIMRVKPAEADTHGVRREITPLGEGEMLLLRESSLKRKLGVPGSKSAARYTEARKIGEGATAYVYALTDLNCDREVAVKILKSVNPSEYPQEVERFVTEASVAAQLEHPNIIPVYNIDVDESGQAYLSMRHVRGSTLKEYIESRQLGKDHQAIQSWGDLVSVILKVCDALSFAHSRDCIHQDIKPDNIMIGHYGEVFVIDWGASSYRGDEMAVTPAYMSPQQAAALDPTPQDDVYCLGATLFHCLLLRLPTDGETLGILMDKKANGVIDEITEKEQASVPGPLLAIALKAMARHCRDRYESIEAFANDLRNYQNGMVVSAYADTFFDFLRRSYRRHRHFVWGLSAAIAVLIAAGAMFYKMKLKEIAYWGEPVFREEFEDGTWRVSWLTKDGAFVVADGWLQTNVGTDFLLLFKERLEGNHAVEFDAQTSADVPPGEIAVVWYEDVEWDRTKTSVASARGEIHFRVGAWDNSFAMIEREGERLDVRRFRLKPAKKYHIRAEVDDSLLSLYVDDQLLCRHEVDIPISSGYIGIAAKHKGKVFDNVRIYAKGVAQKIPVTRLGDMYLRDGNYERAVGQYQRVQQSHPDSRVGREAIYKCGLAYFKMDQPAKAYGKWSELRGTDLNYRIQRYFIQRSFDQSLHKPAINGIIDMYNAGDGNQREAIYIWQKLLLSLHAQSRGGQLAEYLRLQQQFAGDDRFSFPAAQVFAHGQRWHDVLKLCRDQDWAVASAMVELGEFEEVLKDYPHIRTEAARALAHLGRSTEAKTRYPELHQVTINRLLLLGRYEDVLIGFSEYPQACFQALKGLGRLERLKIRYPDETSLHARALVTQGRFEELEEAHPDENGLIAESLLQLGKYEDLLERYPDQHESCAEALLRQGEYERLLKRYSKFPGHRQEVLLRRGRFADFLKLPDRDPDRVLRCLVAVGEIRKALSAFAYSPQYNKVLAHQGRHREIIDRCSPWAPATARAHLARGEFDSVREGFSNDRHLQAHILNLTGRHQQVLKEYSDCRSEAADALVHLGFYDRLGDDYPEQRRQQARGLLQKGKASRVIKRFAEFREETALALIYQGQAVDIPLLYPDLHEAKIIANAEVALQTLVAGNSTKALQVMGRISDEQAGAQGQLLAFAHYQLPYLLEMFNGNTKVMEERFRRIIKESKHVFCQTLWHDVAFIMDAISEEVFMKQPYKLRMKGRLVLCKAIKNEYQKSIGGLAYYSQYAELPGHQRLLNPVVDQFVAWRIETLERR